MTPAGRRLLEIYGRILDDVNKLTPAWEEEVRGGLLEEGGAGEGGLGPGLFFNLARARRR